MRRAVKRPGRRGRRWAALLLAAGLLFAAGLGTYAALRAAFPLAYRAEIEQAADDSGIDRALLYAVAHTESGFDPSAVSEAGALGLTQITPETFSWLQTKTGESLPKEALFEPDVAAKYTAVFLRLLLDEFGGDTATAAAAYHAGRGQVNRWLADGRYSADGTHLDTIPSRATAHYVRKVRRAVRIYEVLYEKELLNHD